MKRKLLSLLLCLCLVSSLMPGMAFAAGEQYDDVSGHWAESSIQRWSGYKVVQGSDGHFRPNASLTRGEMATILANALGLTDQGSSNPFSDVPADAWYAPYVLRCYTAGIMKGDGTTARPTATITRQEAMVMLGRALAIPEKTGADLSAYGDGASVADWAKGAVAAMTEAKIVNGVGDNLLAPGANINRASVVAILDRAVVQYINTPGTHTLVDKDGIVLVAAAGDVTLTGKTPADILVTPAAKGKTLAFDKATITGAVTVQADGMKVTKSDSSLPDIVTAGKDITVEDAKQPATPATPGGSSGGGGGGGNGGGSGTPSVTLTVSGSQGDKLAVGAKLTASVSNANGATLVWNVGGFDQEGAANEYTVTAADMGKVIFAKLVKDGEQVAKSSEYTVTSSAPLDTSEAGKDTAPVVLGNGVAFKNDAGEAITVDPTSLVLSIEEKKDITAQEISKTKTDVAEKVQASVVDAMKTETVTNPSLSDDEKAKLAAATEVKAVDVDLTMVTETTNEATGETTTQETPVHPVGTTTVKLSAAQLGLAGEDLNLYHFVSSHTNKEGTAQTVPGTVDAKGETVTFVTNGLSTIWIGNVPPRTVRFDTGAGGTQVSAQKVKFGNRVNTSKLPEIQRSGYLFCGWNYDLAVTPVIENMTIEAVWVAGSQTPKERITATLSGSDSNITLTTENGKVTAAADKDTDTFAHDLKVNLTVANLNGATKYGVGQSAKTAAAMEAKDMTAVDSNVPLTPVNVTDSNGAVVAGKTSYYIKWMKDDGTVLALEEIVVVVDDGKGAAESKTVTRNVNRGLGRFEPYLTSSTETGAPIWVGYINGHIEKSYRENAADDYALNFDVGFEEWHFNDPYSMNDYDTLSLEFTPFTGENFASKTIYAKFEYYNGTDWVELPCTPVRNGEKLTMTLNTGSLSVPETQHWINVDLYLTVDGVESAIYFSVPNHSYKGTIIRDTETLNFTDMTTLKTALSSVAKDKYYNIRYTGTETQFTISESIDIPENCELNFEGASNEPLSVAVTVASGVTVKMHSAEDNSSTIRCGTFTLNGKIDVDSLARDEYVSQRFADIYCDQITVASGGSIEVKENAPFMLIASNSGSRICTLEAGSTVEVTSGTLNIQNFKTAKLNAQANIVSEGRLYMHNDSNVVGGTVNVNSSNWRGAEFYGTTTITSAGRVSAAGTSRGYTVEFNGPLDNQGSITVANGAKVIVSNMGFASQSSGTIGVNGTLDLSGTKLVNTGTITGSGTITGALGEDTTSYDEKNGLEYVTASGSQTPGNYSRYKFTSDPAKTVDVILYKASLVNEQGGTCSISPTFEEFPAN